MATMTKDGVTVTISIEELAQLFAMGASIEAKPAETVTAKAKTAKKAEAKAAKIRREHDAILDSKRVERMTQTALDKLAAAGFNCKARKQGKWMWLYPTDGKGRTPEFKGVKLAKGWKHSPKRGAFYRDFS